MIDDFQDKLEPYWEDVDGLVEEHMHSIVPRKHFKYFEARRFKLKALWYLRSRVSELDEELVNWSTDFEQQGILGHSSQMMMSLGRISHTSRHWSSKTS